ncbi:MAG: DUF4287 domain-containing protein [Cyclobacteriaceae bacterium]|nr:DUF4287 domain-containing protein [Cyclobacteriaceae bacterium]
MDKALETMINNMPEKTGKPLKEWLEILQDRNFGKHSEAVKFLKEDYKLSHGFANTIAHLAKDNNGEADLIEEQYKGKEGLIPIYEHLKSLITTLGNDIEFAPKKTYVSLRRNKQFALIQPSTKTRLDLGLNLKGKKPSAQLELSGSFNSMCSHRIRISSQDNITDDVMEWLKEAYNAAI